MLFKKTKNLFVTVTKKSWGVKREQINESGESRSGGSK